MGEVLHIRGKVISGRQVCIVLSGHSSNSSIYIVSVFPDIPTPPVYFVLIVLEIRSRELFALDCCSCLRQGDRSAKLSGSKFIKQASSDSVDLHPKAEPQEQRGLSLYTI
jgi:hypothetical protein